MKNLRRLARIVITLLLGAGLVTPASALGIGGVGGQGKRKPKVSATVPD